MSDTEYARAMLKLSQRDFNALRGMQDESLFADEIFGFHAQQACEKALKAWLSLAGISYPRTHDLEQLLLLLQENGERMPENFFQIIDFSDFAVQFRYDILEFDDWEMDRTVVIAQVSEVLEYVDGLIKEAE